VLQREVSITSENLIQLGHYNPHNKTHGAACSDIRHVGDLQSIVADMNGNANTSFTDNQVSLFGKLSIVGYVFFCAEDNKQEECCCSCGSGWWRKGGQPCITNDWECRCESIVWSHWVEQLIINVIFNRCVRRFKPVWFINYGLRLWTKILSIIIINCIYVIFFTDRLGLLYAFRKSHFCMFEIATIIKIIK
jgi:hypothetical protein